MIIGVPKEIKNNENRVGITPAGVVAYKKGGHEVIIESSAGLGSGFTDQDYLDVGAQITKSTKEAWDVDMVIKVKEPIQEEYKYFKENLILYTYLHLAPEPELTRALLESKVTGIAYETIQLDSGALPLLTPMSEVAGRMSVQIGAQFLENSKGGKGVLLGGIPGVAPGNVVIVGAGVVGTNAAKMAVGLGANVTILDVNITRLSQIDDMFQGRVRTLASNTYNIAEAVKTADLLIGAVLIPGSRAPQLVSKEMIQTMQKGSVVVDVAVDQGGSIETIDRITTHSNPTYEVYGVVHYAVANMPGACARTSTMGLSNVTVPYGLQIANKGYRQAALDNPALAKGINVVNGKIVYKAVADAHGLPYTDLQVELAADSTSALAVK
ncbi:alanine dehydrogenase [Lysinibacillus sp. Ag94]|uniref:alanine dehydrogenase n=1 Tax=Lysinibacillus sp. Ag94 TaxID=2936682 RepID=UPI00200C63A0|nr:alanine dehydrogenase [Lysinibacillus sp. Ag94]UPW81713.1 alanine dehydrogenase [Lysinibacillus sp. Ag94]